MYFRPKWLVLQDNSFLTSMQELQMKSRESPPMHTCLFITSITRCVLELDDRDGQFNGYQLLFGIGKKKAVSACLVLCGLILNSSLHMVP
jgi:hypothetical protein